MGQLVTKLISSSCNLSRANDFFRVRVIGRLLYCKAAVFGEVMKVMEVKRTAVRVLCLREGDYGWGVMSEGWGLWSECYV